MRLLPRSRRIGGPLRGIHKDVDNVWYCLNTDDAGMHAGNGRYCFGENPGTILSAALNELFRDVPGFSPMKYPPFSVASALSAFKALPAQLVP